MRGMSMNFPPSVNKKNIKTLGSSMMSLFEWTQRTCLHLDQVYLFSQHAINHV